MEKSFESYALAKARRERAAKFAISSFALEGVHVSDKGSNVLEMWVAGEISDTELERLSEPQK